MIERDIDGDYVRAYREEYAAYMAAGLYGRADTVAAVLGELGHPVTPPAKETAIEAGEVERAVEPPAAPRRPGRPRKPAPTK